MLKKVVLGLLVGGVDRHLGDGGGDSDASQDGR